MSDLLSILSPLLTSRTATVQLTLSKHADGHLSVTAMPVVVSGEDDDDDVKKLVAALSVPVKFTGTIDTILAELQARISTYVPRRKSWEQQLEEIEATLKTPASKPPGKPAKKSIAKPVSSKDAGTAESGTDDNDDTATDHAAAGDTSATSDGDKESAFQL